MPRAIQGVLVECDSSIKAILQRIDTEKGNIYILEEIDDEHILVKKDMYEDLRRDLTAKLENTVKEAEESQSE